MIPFLAIYHQENPLLLNLVKEKHENDRLFGVCYLRSSDGDESFRTRCFDCDAM